MNEAEFYDLVKRMRGAQRDYFACPCPSRRNHAKRLERMVDGWLRERDLSNAPRQAELFCRRGRGHE